MNLNGEQRHALTAFNGEPVTVTRLTGEPSTPAFGMYAIEVVMSTGWTVRLGQHGAVLAEYAPPTQLAYFSNGRRITSVRYIDAYEAAKAILRIVPPRLRPRIEYVVDLEAGESLDLQYRPLCSIRREA